jgi:hypothetical protein
MKSFKNLNKKLIILINLIIIFYQINLIEAKPPVISINTFLTRSLSSYSLNDILLEKTLFISNPKSDSKRNTASLLSGNSEGFRANNSSKNIGSMPFWSGTNTMTIGNNDGKADVDAYQFGLGDIKVNKDGIGGIITLNPKIQLISSDIMLYLTQQQNTPGIFLKAHIPLGLLRVYSNASEEPVTNADNHLSFKQHTEDPNGTEISYQWTKYPVAGERPESLLAAWSGSIDNSNDIDENLPYPTLLQKGRITNYQIQSILGLTDMSISLGYNIIGKDNSLLGIGFKATFALGHYATAAHVLEPIFSQAGSYGLGAELMGYHQFLTDEKGINKVYLWVQGEILHFISGKFINYRSFDLKQNGPGSKYLLLQHYPAAYERNDNYIGYKEFVPSSIQPAINITTLPVISNISLEGSLAFMLDYHHGNYNFGIGTEFWGRSHEKLSIDMDLLISTHFSNLNNYAVLGRQIDSYTINEQPDIVNTYYCEPLARINKSQDPVRLVGTPPSVTTPPDLPDGIKDARLPENRLPSKFEEALDIKGAQARRSFSGTIFAQFGYTEIFNKMLGNVSVYTTVEINNQYTSLGFWSIGFQGSFNF